jgi:hypothetical protein
VHPPAESSIVHPAAHAIATGKRFSSHPCLLCIVLLRRLCDDPPLHFCPFPNMEPFLAVGWPRFQLPSKALELCRRPRRRNQGLPHPASKSRNLLNSSNRVGHRYRSFGTVQSSRILTANTHFDFVCSTAENLYGRVNCLRFTWSPGALELPSFCTGRAAVLTHQSLLCFNCPHFDFDSGAQFLTL